VNQNSPGDLILMAHPAPVDMARKFHHWMIWGLTKLVLHRQCQGWARGDIEQWLDQVLWCFKYEQRNQFPWVVQVLFAVDIVSLPAPDESADTTMQEIHKKGIPIIQQMQKDSWEFSDAITMAEATVRPLFVTKEGFIGNGPHDAQPGDEVWFVHSCSAPLVFRPAPENGTYTLIGCCYLHGFMRAAKMFDPEYDLVSKWRRFTLV